MDHILNNCERFPRDWGGGMVKRSEVGGEQHDAEALAIGDALQQLLFTSHPVIYISLPLKQFSKCFN